MGDPINYPDHYRGIRVRTKSATVADNKTVEVEALDLRRAIATRNTWMTPEQIVLMDSGLKYLLRLGHKEHPRSDLCKGLYYLEQLRDTL